MSYFVWLSGENGIPFIVNAEHIECIDKHDEHYSALRMISGQLILVQESVDRVGSVLPGR